MSRKLFALETCVFCIVVMALRFIFAFLVMLVRCKKKSSLLLKVIPSAFFFVAIFNSNVVRYEICSKFTLKLYKWYQIALRTTFIRIKNHKVFIKQFHETAKSWFKEVIIFLYCQIIFYIFAIIYVIYKLALMKK